MEAKQNANGMIGSVIGRSVIMFRPEGWGEGARSEEQLQSICREYGCISNGTLPGVKSSEFSLPLSHFAPKASSAPSPFYRCPVANPLCQFRHLDQLSEVSARPPGGHAQNVLTTLCRAALPEVNIAARLFPFMDSRHISHRSILGCGQRHLVEENHEYTYQEEVDDNLTCHICLQPLINPLDTPCGHTYCRECLTSFLLESDFCPVDRTSLMLQRCHKSSLLVHRLLDKLAVSCPFTEHCSETLPRGELEGHIKNRSRGFPSITSVWCESRDEVSM
ncbi:hypothetical protein DPEC_G00340480 [Dallia pectoralis]|uniref:Uncharacterized protein n=1 Tax=Dallia pectoralis TaxID=75939 RepID=A0ACC2F542_DALPE|nr:hypothetical protein DPEC_G00340480 [Dallia pectoralis]